MNVAARLTAFAVLLVVVFLLAFGLGRAVGPVGSDSPPDHGGHATSGS